MQKQISESEWKIMKVLWKEQPQTANEIIEHLSEAEWSPRTIRTLISRLVKKEVLGYTQEKREYFYYPLVDKGSLVEEESQSFLEKCYDNSVSMMMTHFIKDSQLSAQEIDALKKLLDDKGDN